MESSERTIAVTVILLPVRSEDSKHPTVTPLSEVENAPPLTVNIGFAQKIQPDTNCRVGCAHHNARPIVAGTAHPTAFRQSLAARKVAPL